ncbi:MAG: 4-(cytidine 5'-diphospho)-2-C-methyl-D-erythritol kinase [Actinomycetaceae bacterium]|nr:4-(cytidine 5'-diphospho)-2-C-methyl-D-erythritol kinase [Actinomycetaceae bacterium]
MTVIASAPGKVNLVLLVAKPDERVYHPLYSIFETLNIRETASVQVRPPAQADVLIDGYPIVVTTTAPGAELPELADLDPKRHLAWRAAAALWDVSQRRRNLPIPPGHVLDIEITKRIPVAGGMAGGSADAAATLVAVNEVLGLDLDDEYLHEIGRQLGADVPACLQGGISLGLGYGDHMTRLDDADTPQHHWVMVTMDQGLSTPGVFKEFDARGRGRDTLPTALKREHLAALGTADQVGQILENDLQETARELHPTLNRAWEAIEATDAVASILSGSGPTIAVLARDGEHARRLAKHLKTQPGIAGTVVTSGPARPAGIEN